MSKGEMKAKPRLNESATAQKAPVDFGCKNNRSLVEFVCKNKPAVAAKPRPKHERRTVH
jgi:hypothetical protein